MFRVWHELGRYSRCSISACGIKCALNKSIGNMKWHISKNVINHRETAHLWNNECHTTKYDTNVRYYYFKNTLCNIARVVGIKSWVIILISQRRECQVFLSLIYIRVNYDTVQQTWKKKKTWSRLESVFDGSTFEWNANNSVKDVVLNFIIIYKTKHRLSPILQRAFSFSWPLRARGSLWPSSKLSHNIFMLNLSSV